MIIPWFNVLSANSVIDTLYLKKLKRRLNDDGIRLLETEIIGNYMSLKFTVRMMSWHLDLNTGMATPY